MKKLISVPIVLLAAAVVGCAASPAAAPSTSPTTRVISTPAQDGALECAAELARQMGYLQIIGRAERGLLRFERFGRSTDVITATIADGVLRLEAGGYDVDDRAAGPSERMMEEAQLIADQCGAGG